MASQCLHIHDVVLHRTGECQAHPGLHVLKLGPQNPRCIQQFQPPVHCHPLLSPGNTRAVAGFGRLLPSHLVDEGGLAHIGNTNHHSPHRTAHQTLFLPSGDLVLQHLLHHAGELIHPGACFRIGLQHRPALLPEPRPPGPVSGRVGLVRPVEHHQPGLARRDGVDVRVPAGHRDPGVDDLHHDVYIFQIRLDLPPGLGHVPRIPLDIHGFSSIPLPRFAGTVRKKERQNRSFLVLDYRASLTLAALPTRSRR